MSSKNARAIETIEVMIEYGLRHRSSMEPAYRNEPKHKVRDRRFGGRIERQELRALCAALRALRASL